MFFRISQISQENTCVGVFFSNVAALKACNFVNKRLQHRYFPVKFAKFLRTSPVAAYEFCSGGSVRIISVSTYIIISRHFSHVTKSSIFKNLCLRKKTDRNFRWTFLKNRFRHLKLYSNSPCWLARSRCHIVIPFERQKVEVHVFTRANLSGFGMWKFIAKGDLYWRKKVFLLNLRLWHTQKSKIWSIFYGKKFI